MSQLIFSWFDQFGYLAIFIGVMLDNAVFPIPGEIVTLLTGSMVAEGRCAYLPAVLVASIGDVRRVYSVAALAIAACNPSSFFVNSS